MLSFLKTNQSTHELIHMTMEETVVETKTNILPWERITLPIVLALLFLITASLGLAFWVFAQGEITPPEVWEVFQAWPMLFVLNWLPVLLGMLFLYFLTNRPYLSMSLSAVFWLGAGYVNQMKIAMRQSPLMPTDLTLVREVSSIAQGFDPSMLFPVLKGCAILLGFGVLGLLFFRNRKMWSWVRIVGVIVTGVLAFCGSKTLYADEALYQSFPIEGNPYFDVNHYTAKGFAYSFLNRMQSMYVQKPGGYDAKQYQAKEAAAAQLSADIKKPHIIMIMNESFSDLSENPNVHLEDGVDPLKHFKRLAKEDGAVSGHIAVPNFGGGTADTEYDVLTAGSTLYLDNAMPSYSFVARPLDSIPYRLKQAGYDTMALHPGYSWFYNRQNVYQYMGFDQFITRDDFDPPNQSKGGYISEVATTDRILSTFEEHVAKKDTPLFSFTVTIQNHGPYESKYGINALPLKTDLPLSEHENNLLSNYLTGIADGDAELGRLAQFAKESEEPIVLVYFGDHLPGFSNGMDFFSLLDYPIDVNGTPKERLCAYETPFLIWANDSALALTDYASVKESLGLQPEPVISANYLGATMMELLGMDTSSPFLSFVNTLRKELPVLSQQCMMDAGGNYIDTPTPEQQTMITTLKEWQYYKLFDQKLTR